MKSIKFATAGLFFFLAFITQAQSQFVWQDYKWDAAPKLHEISDEEKKEDYTYLKFNRSFEYVYESSGELVMYITTHIIMRINNEKGVESRNKVFIPTGSVIEEMELKARVIDKNGKVIVMDKAGVKKVDNYEDSGPFTIFALEGVEPGCEVEYVYTNKESSDLFKNMYCQFSFTSKDNDITIYSPRNLVFDAKSYNGFPAFKKDSTVTDRNKLYAHLDVMPALHEERYGFYNSSRARVEYKLAYNHDKDRARLFTWEAAGVRYYSALYTFSKKELSEAGSFVKKLKLNGTDAEKVRKLENHIKLNIAQKNGSGEEFVLVDKILNNKYANDMGIMRLFIASLKKLEIPFEVVLTTDRTDRKFDKDFDTWNYLAEYLIYITSEDAYFSPTEFSSRLGYPPSELTANKGLFIKEVSIGDVFSGIAKVKEIKTSDYTASNHNTFVNVTFDPASMNEPAVKVKQVFTGYSAYFYQPVYGLIDDENKLKLNESILKLTGEDAKVTNIKVSNYDEASIFSKPFEMECDLSTTTLVEKAGDKYLFKAGTLIGAQAELYQEGKRQTPAEINYGHGFMREITFNIPDGFKLSNPDDLKKESTCKVNGELQAQFKSEYVIEGKTVKVKIWEDYRALAYPLKSFEEFRKVINAAADFNKVTLVFEKA